jgi:hypothetical protein
MHFDPDLVGRKGWESTRKSIQSRGRWRNTRSAVRTGAQTIGEDGGGGDEELDLTPDFAPSPPHPSQELTLSRLEYTDRTLAAEIFSLMVAITEFQPLSQPEQLFRVTVSSVTRILTSSLESYCAGSIFESRRYQIVTRVIVRKLLGDLSSGI